jgi:3,4-dihydroxy-2-butanone 4-phosphate synthase
MVLAEMVSKQVVMMTAPETIVEAHEQVLTMTTPEEIVEAHEQVVTMTAPTPGGLSEIQHS